MVCLPMGGGVKPAKKSKRFFVCVREVLQKIQKDMCIKILNLYKKAKITEFALHLYPEHVA